MVKVKVLWASWVMRGFCAAYHRKLISRGEFRAGYEWLDRKVTGQSIERQRKGGYYV